MDKQTEKILTEMKQDKEIPKMYEKAIKEFKSDLPTKTTKFG